MKLASKKNNAATGSEPAASVLTNEPDYQKFQKYIQWLADNLAGLSPEKIKSHRETYKRGVSRVSQLALSYGQDWSAPDIESIFANGEKNASKVVWFNPKIEGYKKVGMWHGKNHKTEDGLFVFNVEWLNRFTDGVTDSKSARFKLKLYMDLDCEPIHQAIDKTQAQGTIRKDYTS